MRVQNIVNFLQDVPFPITLSILLFDGTSTHIQFLLSKNSLNFFLVTKKKCHQSFVVHSVVFLASNVNCFVNRKEKKEKEILYFGPKVTDGENVFAIAHIYASFNNTFLVCKISTYFRMLFIFLQFILVLISENLFTYPLCLIFLSTLPFLHTFGLLLDTCLLSFITARY